MQHKSKQMARLPVFVVYGRRTVNLGAWIWWPLIWNSITHTCLPLMYIRGTRKFVHIIDKGPYSLQCRYHFLNVPRPRKSIPYRIGRYKYWPVYIIPASALVQIPLLFRTKKNTGRIGHADEIRLFWLVNGYQVKIEKSQRKFSWIFRTYLKLLHLVGAEARAGATPPPTTSDNPNPPISTLKNPTHTTQPPHKHTTHEQKSSRCLSLLCISPNKTHWFKNK